jgi:hypothetical protein
MKTRVAPLAALLRHTIRIVAAVAGLAVVAAHGAAIAAAPDVAVTVVAYDGRKPIARAAASGRFGERLVAGVDGVMRVELVVDPPGAHGFASMQMSRYRWVDGIETQDYGRALTLALALEAAPVDGCHPPNIGPSPPPEGFWICVMPRAGTPPPTPPAQWPERTREALDRLRALLEDVHPAPIRDDDPAFRRWLVEGHAEAHALAAKVRTPAQQTGVLKFFAAGFRDGHLQLDGPWAEWPRWAGWVAAYEHGRFVVAYAEPGWPVALPPAGATIVACDGRVSLDLLASDVAPWVDRDVGRNSARQRLAPELAIDMGEIAGRRMPRRCTFALPDGGRRTLALQYRAIHRGALNAVLRRARGAPDRDVFFAEDLGEGRWWVRVPTFDVDANGLRQIEGVATRLELLADGRLVVFDLRGNAGGNSALGERLFDALTGGLEASREQMAQVPHALALWRVSSRTLAEMEASLRVDRANRGADHPSAAFKEDMAPRLRGALARGEPWVEQPGGAALTPALVRDLRIATKRFRGQLVVLTDEACFSACLDFVDVLLLVPGAIHVGRTTGADTRYMDVGYFRIAPQVVVQVPRKVWLGRPRGDNAPHVPAIVFDGDIGDDAAVRHWVVETIGRR